MTGKDLLKRFRSPLHRLAVTMAVDKYGSVPDTADRVGDARLALVEAASTFQSAPRRDGFGYFVRYILGQIAGNIRHGAGYARILSDTETSFVDLSEIMVARLEEPSRLASEALWYLNNDTVASTTSVIASVMADKKRIKVALARLADEGTEATEEQLPMILLRALTELEEREMAPVPVWTREPAEHGLVAHDLEAVAVIRTSRDGSVVMEVIEGSAFTEMVNQASAGSVVWDDESTEVRYDDRSEPPRYDINPSADNLAPEDCIPSSLWRCLVQAFTEATLDGQDSALRKLGKHWDRLDPDDPSKRKALFALAEDIVSNDTRGIWKKADIAPAVLAYGVLRKLMEVETPGGWEPPELPSLRSLRGPALSWISDLQEHCWPSQYAGITALALHRASPSEARVVEERVYQETRF